MRIRSLRLEHFRNYHRLDVVFPESKILLLVGDNGQGKTNFLESLVILALSKSYQPMPLKEMVNWYLHEEQTGLPAVLRLKCDIEYADKLQQLEISCGRTASFPRTLKADGAKVAPRDYIGHLHIVLFTPQDLNLMMLAPRWRRRYADVFLSQLDREYVEQARQYRNILMQRNRLLESVRLGQSQASELDPWDQSLATAGGYLLWKRRQVWKAFGELLSEQYAKMSGAKSTLQLHWKKDWPDGAHEAVTKAFSDYLSFKRARDIEVGRTCGGPHRDDFSFVLNGRDLAQYGSRGECRSAVLALKMAEIEYIKRITGESPVVLLDDVFSELDVSRQKNLLQSLEADQIIVTTTHVEFEVADAVVWKVREGEISSLTPSAHN